MLIESRNDQNVVSLELNRPEVHNAFNDELIEILTKKFEELSADDSIRLITITGKGKSFCAGADLNWMKRMKDYSDDENYRDSVAMAKMFETMNACSHPLVAIVNGAALGGGVGLISVCDYVLACQSSKFGLTEVALGLLPAVISPFVIAKIGESNARAYFLSGERFDGTKAQELGLVHRICPLDDLESQKDKVIERFLRAAPQAAKEAKVLVKNVVAKGHLNDHEALREYTCRTISRIRVGDEAQEGMAALLDKRSPNWKEGQ
jgi:methylglutaconyl-CoA hydratase